MTPTYNIGACKVALAKRGWEQKDLAEDGLSESVISKFFRGETVLNSTAKRIVDKLGLKMKDVVREEAIK